MFLELKQTKNELYEAEHTLLRGGAPVGVMRLSGRPGSMEGVWSVSFGGSTAVLQRGVYPDIPRNACRPYVIYSGDGSAAGCVYQTVSEGGLFDRFAYHRCVLNGRVYDMFPISLGEGGVKNPVYTGGRQVGQIEKDTVIYNGLHDFRVYSTDPVAETACVVICCYMYSLAFFKPGKKPIRTTEKFFDRTKNKRLLAMYDESFVRKL